MKNDISNLLFLLLNQPESLLDGHSYQAGTRIELYHIVNQYHLHSKIGRPYSYSYASNREFFVKDNI
mgnify:CR=1 FL=1